MDDQEDEHTPAFEYAHERAKEVMRSEFYFDVMEEAAPFGSDDGADAFAGFRDWREENGDESPVDFIYGQIEAWDYPVFDLEETRYEEIKPYLDEHQLGARFLAGIDALIVAVAFGQLYLEGTVHPEARELTEAALRRQLDPALLSSWGEHAAQRQHILSTMLSDLARV